MQSSVRAIRHLARTERAGIDVSRDDRASEEIVEDELETRVRRSGMTARIVDALLAAIEDRFLLLKEGELHRDGPGWLGIERLLSPIRIDPARPKVSRRTIGQLNALLDALTAEAVPVETGPSRPVYRARR